MNADDMMSSPSHPQGYAAEEMQAKNGAAWDTKKFREDYDAAKSKLSDQKFESTEYPDPLLPRKGIKAAYKRTFPDGTEERLKELVAKTQESSS